MSQPMFYDDDAISGVLTTTYRKIDFGFITRNFIIIAADSTNTDSIIFSTDGVTIHSKIKAGEPLNLSNKKNRFIYLKAASVTQKYRLFCY